MSRGSWKREHRAANKGKIGQPNRARIRALYRLGPGTRVPAGTHIPTTSAAYLGQVVACSARPVAYSDRPIAYSGQDVTYSVQNSLIRAIILLK